MIELSLVGAVIKLIQTSWKSGLAGQNEASFSFQNAMIFIRFPFSWRDHNPKPNSMHWNECNVVNNRSSSADPVGESWIAECKSCTFGPRSGLQHLSRAMVAKGLLVGSWPGRGGRIVMVPTKSTPSGFWSEGVMPWKPGQQDRPDQGSSSITTTKEQSTSACAALRNAPALAFVVMRIS